jgi:cytochrome c
MKLPHLLPALLLACVLPAVAQDDLAAARRLALNHCGVCHSFGEGEPARQGPNLRGVMARPAGSAAGFAYSDGFRNAVAGRNWDAELLDRWLADPQAVAPGTVMLYRQDDPEKRALLARFLEALQ